MIGRQRKPMPRCVLQSMDNALMGSGRIARREDTFLEMISNNPLPVLMKGTMAKIVVYDISQVSVWKGTVYYSTYERLRLEDIVLCSDSEKRKLHRVDIRNPAKLLVFKRNPEPDEEDKTGESVYGLKLMEVPVVVRDISSGGCGIEMTKRVNLRGRALKIRLTTLDSVEEIQVEIRNSREKNADTMLYGFMFLNTNQRVEKAIDAYIFKVQQEQIRKSRR